MSMRHADIATSGPRLLAAAAALSDEALLARVADLARASRAVTVELLAHLGELERRRLHRGEGCGRLFGYCTQVLRLSEAAAINRIRAARAARRFPIVLEMLADGRLNLTSVRLLAPHLTPENHRRLLDEVRGMTRREVDKVDPGRRAEGNPGWRSVRDRHPGAAGLSARDREEDVRRDRSAAGEPGCAARLA
jgi:hypothetical protein